MRTVMTLLILFLLAGQGLAFVGAAEKFSETEELSNLPGMASDVPKYMIGTSEAKGVKAVAYVNDLREKMAKYGLKKTHHLMVEFMDVSSGELIEVGSVAVKVEAPNGATGNAVELLNMQGGFGADIALEDKGVYQLKVGTELNDGNKRIFLFNFRNH